MSPTKLVNFVFAASALLLGWLVVAPTVEWIWGAFDPRPPELWCAVIGLALAGTAGWTAWKHERVHTLAGEVVVELTKVTWPTRPERKWATIVVLITVVVASLFLAAFDAFWSWSTSKIYG